MKSRQLWSQKLIHRCTFFFFFEFVSSSSSSSSGCCFRLLPVDADCWIDASAMSISASMVDGGKYALKGVVRTLENDLERGSFFLDGRRRSPPADSSSTRGAAEEGEEEEVMRPNSVMSSTNYELSVTSVSLCPPVWLGNS